MKLNLLADHLEIAEQVNIEQWIEQPGIPDHHHEPVSDALDQVAVEAQAWLAKTTAGEALPSADWTTQHWLHFLRTLPDELPADRMAELDKASELTGTGNSEILCEWLIMSVRNDYSAADRALENFLTSVGRRKFLKPLYEELAKTEQGKQRGLEIYRKARGGYHPISSNTVDGILGWTD